MVESDATFSCVNKKWQAGTSTEQWESLRMDDILGGPVDARALAPASRIKTGPKLYDVISLGDLCVDVMVTTDKVSSLCSRQSLRISVTTEERLHFCLFQPYGKLP